MEASEPPRNAGHVIAKGDQGQRCDPPAIWIITHKLENILEAALQLFPIDVASKTVVLKPNLVDYLPGDAINTHPSLVLAAAECFRRLGAKSVLVAEGPGHQRDTQLVLSQSGYEDSLRGEKIR